MDGGKPDGPPAGQQQEPGADRPIEAGKPQIGARAFGSEAVDPVAGRGRDAAPPFGHRASGLPTSVSKVPWPRADDASGTVGVVPSASLRVGPAGRGPCAAASQIFLVVCVDRLWESLTCLMMSGGTPQVELFSSN